MEAIWLTLAIGMGSGWPSGENNLWKEVMCACLEVPVLARFVADPPEEVAVGLLLSEGFCGLVGLDRFLVSRK